MVGRQRRRDLTSRVNLPSPSPFCHSQRTSTSDGNSESGLINCVTSTGSSVEGSSTLEIACADPSRVIGANLSVALYTLRRLRKGAVQVLCTARSERLSLKRPRQRRPGNGDWKFRARHRELNDERRLGSREMARWRDGEMAGKIS